MTKEEKIPVFTNEAAIKNDLNTAKATAERLTGIYAKLIAIGALDVSLNELRKLIKSDGHPSVIREIVLADINLEVRPGVYRDISSYKLDEKQTQALSLEVKKFNPGKYTIEWGYFDVKDGKVVCLDCAETSLRERYTVYANKEVKAAIDEAAKICDLINKFYKKHNITTFHPLRDTDALLHHDGSQFTPHIYNLSQYI